MNVKELRNLLETFEDNLPVAISLSNGTLDFVVFVHKTTDCEGEVVVINGN